MTTMRSARSNVRRAAGWGLKVGAAAVDGVRRPPRGVTVLIYHRVGGGTASEVDLDVDDLIVAEAHVGKSLVIKRYVPRGRGKSGRIFKPARPRQVGPDFQTVFASHDRRS